MFIPSPLFACFSIVRRRVAENTLFFSLNFCDRKVGFYFFKSKLYPLVTLIIKNPKFNIIKINFTDYNLFFLKKKITFIELFFIK